MNIMFFILIVILLMLAGWFDISQRCIPNIIVAAIVVLWLPHMAAQDLWIIVASLVTACVLLGCGIVVWRLGWLGGGDVKLITALSLWVGPFHTPALLLATALSGGVLALLYAAMRHPLVTPFRTVLQVQCHRLLPSSAGAGGSPGLPRAGGAAARSIPYGLPSPPAAAGCCSA